MVNEKSEWLMIYVPTIHQSTPDCSLKMTTWLSPTYFVFFSINFEGFYSKNEQFRFSLKMTQFLVFHQRTRCGLLYPVSKDRVDKFGLQICVFQSVRVKISQNLCFGFSYFENLSQVNMTFENVFSFVFWIFC